MFPMMLRPEDEEAIEYLRERLRVSYKADAVRRSLYLVQSVLSELDESSDSKLAIVKTTPTGNTFTVLRWVI